MLGMLKQVLFLPAKFGNLANIAALDEDNLGPDIQIFQNYYHFKNWK